MMRRCLFGWALLWPLLVTAAPAEYSFGVAPQFSARQIAAVWQPILDQLSRRAGVRLVLQGVAQIPEFEQRFLAGRYDFAYMSSYHARLAARHQGYRALVRDQDEPVSGVLVVRREGPVHTVADLAGKTIVFPSTNALAASLLVRADLARRFRIRFAPRYVGTHTAVYLNVAQGLADAGGGTTQTLMLQPESVRTRLRVIHHTTPVPAHPVVAHPRVPQSVQDRVRRAFIELGNSAEGRALLAAIPIRRIGPARPGDDAAIEPLDLEPFANVENPP